MFTTRALLLNTNSQCRQILKNQLASKYPTFSSAQRKLNSSFQHDQSNSRSTDSDKLNRIYYGTLTPRMKMVKIFTLTTSLSGIAAQPILIEQGSKIGGTPLVVFLCGFVGFFTFVTPLLLHFITKKYVTEIYYDPQKNEYTANTLSLILRKIETKFKPSDVKVPEVPGMFTSFVVGKKSLFIDPSLFTDPEHYVKIMGYDKPIDFKLDTALNNESNSKEKTKN